MHVITRKRLLDFAEKHPKCASALDTWYRIVKHTRFTSFAESRLTFPSVDQVGNKTVFNIGGNKARLLAVIHYRAQRVYIRYVLTHREYDRGKWKE